MVYERFVSRIAKRVMYLKGHKVLFDLVLIIFDIETLCAYNDIKLEKGNSVNDQRRN